MKASLGYKLIVPVVAVGLGLFAAGCGSDEPEYCSNVDSLEQSVNDLGDVELEGGLISNLEAQFNEVEQNAQAVEQSAREDFPDETAALEESISALEKSIEKLPESPSNEQLLKLAPEIVLVVDRFAAFDSATQAECD